jgi:hypothetical protein
LIGAVSEKSIDQHIAAARQNDARALVAKARSSEQTSPSAPSTREQRLAEAREFRRRANNVR